MNFLPYDRVTYKTYLRPEEVQQRLENSIEPTKIRWFSFRKEAHKPYQGTLTWPTFNIHRVIFYRNSFLPMIRGEVQEEMGQTVVTVTMHPHVLVLGFMVIWLFLPLNFCAAGLLAMASNPAEGGGELFAMAIPFMLFGLALLLLPYKWEARQSKKFFQELLEAASAHEKSLFG